MRTRKLLGLLFVLATALAGCENRLQVRSGTDVQLLRPEQLTEKRLALVRDQARADMNCKDVDEVTTLPKDADQSGVDFADLFLAQGCGQKIEYAQVSCDQVEFVPISQDSPAHKSLRAAHGTAACDSAGRAIVYIRLSENGARDLECPRTDVIPQHPRHSQPHIVEGCGKRAYYAPGIVAKPTHVTPIGPP
jgi:hypothetical protein